MTPELIEHFRGVYTASNVENLKAFRLSVDNVNIKTKCTCKRTNIIKMVDNFYVWYDQYKTTT